MQAQGAVQRALELQLFGKFTSRERLVVVDTSAQIILLNNPERIGYIMVNTGSTKVTFALRQDVQADRGFVLPEQGDTVTVNYIEDGQFPTRELSAIASTSASELFIVEFIRYSV